MTEDEKIELFLENGPWAVVGATANRAKYGNKCLRVFQQHDMDVYPINPKGGEIEGLTAYENLSALPRSVQGISVITSPAVTEQVVEEAGKQGVRNIWLQPGAESDTAVQRAEELGMNVIHGGACILVVLGFRG